eukprot:4761751-Prymnesium_polylepis.1
MPEPRLRQPEGLARFRGRNVPEPFPQLIVRAAQAGFALRRHQPRYNALDISVRITSATSAPHIVPVL